MPGKEHSRDQADRIDPGAGHGPAVWRFQEPASHRSQPRRRPPDRPAPAPRLPNGRPDLTGVWMPPYVPDMTRSARDQQGYAEPPFSPSDTPQARQAMYARGNRAELPFTASGLQDWSTYDAADGDYTGSCLPYGLTRSFNAPYPYQILQSDTLIAVLFELNTWHHLIHLRGEASGGAGADVVWTLDRPVGRRHAGRRHHRLQRLHAAGHDRPPAQRGVARHPDVQAHRCRAHRLHRHHRRSEDLHEAVEERARPHVAQDAAARVLVRREQQEPVGWTDQGVDAAMGAGESRKFKVQSSKLKFKAEVQSSKPKLEARSSKLNWHPPS